LGCFPLTVTSEVFVGGSPSKNVLQSPGSPHIPTYINRERERERDIDPSLFSDSSGNSSFLKNFPHTPKENVKLLRLATMHGNSFEAILPEFVCQFISILLLRDED